VKVSTIDHTFRLIGDNLETQIWIEGDRRMRSEKRQVPLKMIRSTTPSRSLTESIEEDLRVEADAAIELHQIAREEYWRVAFPPNGDSGELREAANRQNVTRHALVMALIRFNDFVRHGIIPEDLKNGDGGS
jgi:hypothetical protein